MNYRTIPFWFGDMLVDSFYEFQSAVIDLFELPYTSAGFYWRVFGEGEGAVAMEVGYGYDPEYSMPSADDVPYVTLSMTVGTMHISIDITEKRGVEVGYYTEESLNRVSLAVYPWVQDLLVEWLERASEKVDETAHKAVYKHLAGFVRQGYRRLYRY